MRKIDLFYSVFLIPKNTIKMYEYIVTIIFISIVISICKSIIVPNTNVEKLMQPIIFADDLLLDRSKSAFYDYKTKGTIYTKKLIKYRERLIERYHLYRKIKNMDIDNPGVTIDYIEHRMEEFFDLLQSFPPF